MKKLPTYDSSLLDKKMIDLIPSPSEVRRLLAMNYKEASFLRRLLKLSEDVYSERVDSMAVSEK